METILGVSQRVTKFTRIQKMNESQNESRHVEMVCTRAEAVDLPHLSINCLATVGQGVERRRRSSSRWDGGFRDFCTSWR